MKNAIRFSKNLISYLALGKLALAYLEPGSSSFLLKILISSLVGLVVFFRQIWGYIRLVIEKVTKKRPAKTAAPSSQPPFQNKEPENAIRPASASHLSRTEQKS